MGLFGKKKGESCCCGDITPEKTEQVNITQNEDAAVKVLGPGCKKCNELETNTKAALTQLGMDTAVGHVTDFAAIAAYGVMTTPALVIGKKVVSVGKVLKKDEVIGLINKHEGK